jgi:RNA polymerase sigma-70 factor (ECF subfamily)
MDSGQHIADNEIETTNTSGELCTRYLDQIYRYVIYQVRHKAIAEYLTQVIFIEAWRGSKSNEWDESQFSAWLYRIAHRRVAEYFRANPQVSIEEIHLLRRDSDLGQEIDADEIERFFVSIIACLPEQQRQVVVLKFINCLDNLEIAQVMGNMQGTIKMLQMQALAVLQRKLGKDLEDTEITTELAEVLDECLTSIRNGATVELCLSKYFYARQVLEPLLNTAASISCAPKASPSEEFKSAFKLGSIAGLRRGTVQAKRERNGLHNHGLGRMTAVSPKLSHALSGYKRMPALRPKLAYVLSFCKRLAADPLKLVHVFSGYKRIATAPPKFAHTLFTHNRTAVAVTVVYLRRGLLPWPPVLLLPRRILVFLFCQPAQVTGNRLQMGHSSWREAK